MSRTRKEEMSEKNLARVMSGQMLSHSVTKDINGECF